jgi:hypothetical protein
MVGELGEDLDVPFQPEVGAATVRQPGTPPVVPDHGVGLGQQVVEGLWPDSAISPARWLVHGGRTTSGGPVPSTENAIRAPRLVSRKRTSNATP